MKPYERIKDRHGSSLDAGYGEPPFPRDFPGGCAERMVMVFGELGCIENTYPQKLDKAIRCMVIWNNLERQFLQKEYFR